MNTFKFRGKYVCTYIYGSLVTSKTADGEIKAFIITEKGSRWEVEAKSVAQFVGYDKNGEEIYSDDFILETPFPDAVPQKYLAGDRIVANRFGEKFDNVELVKENFDNVELVKENAEF